MIDPDSIHDSKPHAPPRRQPGELRGEIWMAPDFDDLPEDFLDAMEADDPSGERNGV